MFKRMEVIGLSGKCVLYRRPEGVKLYKEWGPNIDASYPCVTGIQGGQVKASAGSDKGGKYKTCISDEGTMILGSARILCRKESKLGDATVDGWHDILHLASFDMIVFRGAMLRGGDIQS